MREGLTESTEKLVIMAVVQVVDQVSKDGKLRQNLIHFRGLEDLCRVSNYVDHQNCLTFFFTSTRPNVSVPATTDKATKSL